MTMPSPAGGTKTNRAKIIAAVVRSPSFELPGPASKRRHCYLLSCVEIKRLLGGLHDSTKRKK